MVSAHLVLGVATAFASISAISAAPAGDSLEVPDDGREKAGFYGVNRERCDYVLGVDHPGFDVASQTASSFRDCDNFCFANDKCVVWTWTKHNGGTCWLKSYHGGNVDNSDAISLSCSLEKYSPSTPAPDPPREKAPFDGVNREPCYYDQDTDRPGYDLANKPGKSFRDCSELCFAQEGCATWAWNDYNGGTCWLKTYNGGGVKKVGAVSLSCSIDRHESKRAIKSHASQHHHKVSVKVHDGNVTVKISAHQPVLP